jgi:hypothetical protein
MGRLPSFGNLPLSFGKFQEVDLLGIGRFVEGKHIGLDLGIQIPV